MEELMSLVGSYDETDSFVDYQTRMVGACKEIARLSTDMMAKSATDASRLVQVGNEMCEQYERLAQDSSGASATTPNADVANRIRLAVVELGEAVAELIKAGGHCRLSAIQQNQRAVADRAKTVNEKVVSVLGALQAGSRGTQACIDAAATIAHIIGDLDTTILFASAGTLHSEKENDTFSDHRENILKTAKTLVEDTKTLVGGAAGTQDQLAEAAQSAVNTIVQLCEVVKQGAMSLGSHSPEPQVLLLHAARDVASALRDLASATTAASGKHVSHPDMQRLKHAAKRLSDTTKRWSLPAKSATIPRQNKRRSLTHKNDYNSCDSETDIFQSDQEEELIKLLDYSSQDDDVSPTIFHDNCEEAIAYIEMLMKNPPKRQPKNDDLNERYNMAARNSLIDMDWRVLKYGENIFLGEIKKLVDLFVEFDDTRESRRKRDMLQRMKANSDLDNEMKRLSQVLEDLDEVEYETNIKNTNIKSIKTIISAKKPKKDIKNIAIKDTIFKITKVKPVSLIAKLEPVKIEEEPPKPEPSPEKVVKRDSPQKGEIHNIKMEFWEMFRDDSEWWKALAKRNLEKMEETRKELQRFSGHELVLQEFHTERDKYEKEKDKLQNFIDEVDQSKAGEHLEHLEYDKKYEDIVLKLIEFAKKDFVYKGFDPLIEQLKTLANTKIEGRKKKVNIQDIVNIYSQIDISKYTYEELCLLEKHYKQIIRQYKTETQEKENLVPTKVPREKSTDVVNEMTQTDSPSYHKNVILNIHSSQNTTKNINQYTSSVSNGEDVTLSKQNKQGSKNNIEIFDLTRTYPLEYYANNWWTIYEDILKSREHQFGSIDNWWHFYEAILNKTATSDEELKRIRAVVEYRNSLRKSRPNSRMEEQLKMLDDVKHSFQETEERQNEDKESVMVTNVTSLLKTVKAVEDEHTRGTRALESTIEAISQEMEVLMSSSPPKSTSTPEELVRCTRQMTVATARAVSAGNSNKQDQLTAAANLGRKTVVDLLVACKGAAHNAESAELRTRTLQAGREAASAYRALLAAVLGAGAGDAAARARFPDLSRRVAHTVADIIAAAELLKGSDWVDPDDPTVIAENELLGAAASIDAAAKKLDSLRPRKAVTVQEADESLNFDEMILEAAKSIITATSALVRAASSAQRELIDQGKVARRPTSSSDDGQWSEGLISAARLVAAAAHSLVEAANALVQGAGSEERLISSARQVASSTAQLLVACKVKADPSSESTRRLQAAGAEVIRSTDNLVRAARNAIQCEEERSLVLNRRMVGGIAQEIDARSEILRIEKELEEARGRLNAIRQAKYKLKTGDTSGEETDTDVQLGYTSDASGTHRFKTPNSSFVNTTYSPNSTQYSTQNITQNTTQNTTHNTTQINQSQNYQSPQSPGYNGYSQKEKYTVQSPTFSSFRPQEDAPKNYEGFTTRYETRLYDTPRPTEYTTIDEQRQYESNHYTKESKYGYDAPKPQLSPLSPKFNARELKFDDKPEPIYSTLNKPGTPKSPYDGIGQTFNEHHKSTEAIPGGTKQSEYSIKSESYQSYPKTEYSKVETKQEIKSPFATSTPSKSEFSQFSQSEYGKNTSTDLVKAVTPDYERMSSPYGKDVHSYSGPNYKEETTTEVKDIPNGTQKITTTKIYSSSPVNLISTSTKYEPVKLEGIDELSKSFDNESRYSTLDSRFNTLESKLSSDTSRSFMRPSEFQSDYQVVNTKVDLNKELDNMDKKFSKQTISSERIEKKSIMTSSHKSETSSTVTKKFGNF